jgi:hypothetical protein
MAAGPGPDLEAALRELQVPRKNRPAPFAFVTLSAFTLAGRG